ncbi:hypothetical protein B0H19DRAFT_1243163 [Mycena capillaripes]|nr:hypothetical protein B0H19DRAFT_1243163 [Mycena capillaripes]
MHRRRMRMVCGRNETESGGDVGQRRAKRLLPKENEVSNEDHLIVAKERTTWNTKRELSDEKMGRRGQRDESSTGSVKVTPVTPNFSRIPIVPHTATAVRITVIMVAQPALTVNVNLGLDVEYEHVDPHKNILRRQDAAPLLAVLRTRSNGANNIFVILARHARLWQETHTRSRTSKHPGISNDVAAPSNGIGGRYSHKPSLIYFGETKLMWGIFIAQIHSKECKEFIRRHGKLLKANPHQIIYVIAAPLTPPAAKGVKGRQWRQFHFAHPQHVPEKNNGDKSKVDEKIVARHSRIPTTTNSAGRGAAKSIQQTGG